MNARIDLRRESKPRFTSSEFDNDVTIYRDRLAYENRLQVQ